MKLYVNLKETNYCINIENGLLDKIAEEIKEVFKGNKIFIITDKTVDKYYGDKVFNNLIKAGYDTKKLALEAGESTKSFKTLPLVYDELVNLNLQEVI